MKSWVLRLMVRNITALDRALSAKRASRRVAFRQAFVADSDLAKDIVAMANSGGGIIFFPPDANLDAAAVGERVRDATGTRFTDLKIAETERGGALIVGAAKVPMVIDGTIYFRHGGKSQPGTSEDLLKAIDRRVKELRRSWVKAVKQVVEAPPPPLLPREIRDSESPEATPIRIVDDPTAPAFRVVDYDKTHPYRQKEILATLHERLPGVRVNQFDFLSVRHVFNTDANPDFSHKPMFGSRQYSQKFVDWLIEQAQRNPSFFDEARQKYRGAPPTAPES
jgi:hypothetical protein